MFVCQLTANIKNSHESSMKNVNIIFKFETKRMQLKITIKIFAISNKGKNKTVYVYFVKQKLLGYSPSSVLLNGAV